MERKKKIKLIVIASIVILAVVSIGAWAYLTYFDDSWIVKIDGEKVSMATFKERVSRMDPEVRQLLKSDPRMFVDGFIAHLLLLKEAKRVANVKVKDANDEAQLINDYLMKKTGDLPPVADKEIDDFYTTYKDRFSGRAKADVTPFIRAMLEQRQLYERVQKLVEELKAKSKVEINERAMKRLSQMALAEPPGKSELKRALASGKLVVAEFGTDDCAPCRELRPILRKIKTEYAGRVEVITIDVRAERDVTNQYGVMVVPTLLFFDRGGKEQFRHQGYLSEDNLKEKIAQLEAGPTKTAPAK